jgi:hypothetical protein
MTHSNHCLNDFPKRSADFCFFVESKLVSHEIASNFQTFLKVIVDLLIPLKIIFLKIIKSFDDE